MPRQPVRMQPWIAKAVGGVRAPVAQATAASGSCGGRRERCEVPEASPAGGLRSVLRPRKTDRRGLSSALDAGQTGGQCTSCYQDWGVLSPYVPRIVHRLYL